eukprot:TRINITY_DN12636_c0_g1_i7.p1 TRINITY_DN12636_c0_g1~~TRINITY_DN12636_c0_g1_i7.p1  ORF type:complete len:144 (+),score=30.77 TRINITY_DN12636_c0_g1_i7:389-820(+)
MSYVIGDLWGPLLICLFLAMTLGFQHSSSTEGIFGTIFVLVWLGAFVVTLNAKLLGSNTSILRSVCVLGYCIAPLDISAVLLVLMGKEMHFVFRFVAAALGYAWASFSSISFMSTLLPEEKKLLGVFPVLLFYLVLAWFVLMA